MCSYRDVTVKCCIYVSPVSILIVYVQGYGVELAVKNMEYKSIDDKKVFDYWLMR